MLDREEYVEQAYFFKTLGERMLDNHSTQETLEAIGEEILSTTKLPHAVGYMLAELKHGGVLAPAMKRLGHYFTPFQSFVMGEAENDRSRFDLRVALEILRREAEYRAAEPTTQGIFLYQFECLCRNRLGYDRGLEAMAADPIFDQNWRKWIVTVRRQVGMVEIADLIYVRSEHYLHVQAQAGHHDEVPPVLFGRREGQIAVANRKRDPLLLFAALHRQLGYPAIPRTRPEDLTHELVPQLLRRLERVEHRIKLVEEEQRGGIDLARYYKPPEQGE